MACNLKQNNIKLNFNSFFYKFMLKHIPFGPKSCVNTDILKVLQLKIIGDNFCKPDPKSNHHKGKDWLSSLG